MDGGVHEDRESDSIIMNPDFKTISFKLYIDRKGTHATVAAAWTKSMHQMHDLRLSRR